MAVTREEVMNALLAALAGITAQGVPLVAYGRRLRDPENVPGDQRPALFVVEEGDSWDGPINLPAKRTLTVWAVLYTDVGMDESLIPSTQVNYYIESIEAALAPDDRATNRFTLGGRVFSCQLEGAGLRVSGDTTGKSFCALPITILLI